MEYPNLLILSHNALSKTKNNGKTVSALLSGWPKNKISQLYITDEIPDRSICNSFYRITDKEILKGFFSKKNKVGQVINENVDTNQINIPKALSPISKLFGWIVAKRFLIIMLLRDFLWNRNRWQVQELKDWIIEQNPQVVFLVASNYTLIYNVLNYINTLKKVSVVVFLTDNHHLPFANINPFYWLHMKLLHQSWRNIPNHYSTISICDELGEAYNRKFGGKYVTAMNCQAINNSPPPNNDTIKLLYAGNLYPNRWKTLFDIGTALKRLSVKGINASLNIYSLDSLTEKVKKKLHFPPYSFFHGGIDSAELSKIRADSDIMVHVEGFDRQCRKIMLYSMSTKIPEYLSSNRCIFAVVPEDYAEAKYLKQYDAAHVVIDVNDIEMELERLLQDKSLQQKYESNGISLARNRHDPEKQRELVKNEIINSIEKLED